MDLSNVIGKNVIYQDYLGQNRSGKIAFIEPYESGDSVDSEGKVTVWVYIADEDYDMNTNEYLYQDPKTGELRRFMYCEVRLSKDCFIDE